MAENTFQRCISYDGETEICAVHASLRGLMMLHLGESDCPPNMEDIASLLETINRRLGNVVIGYDRGRPVRISGARELEACDCAGATALDEAHGG